MKDVAIVVVTYNRKELLRKNLEALLKQTYKNYDIYIIDNFSSDGTYEYIRDIVQSNNIIYENTNKNLGGAGGFNFGLKKVLNMDYKYVWLMDDDTITNNESLEELINADRILKR